MVGELKFQREWLLLQKVYQDEDQLATISNKIDELANEIERGAESCVSRYEEFKCSWSPSCVREPAES